MHKQIDMVRADCQFYDVPPPLVALVLDEATAIGGNVACQHRLAPLGGPDRVVDDGMYPVSVAEVFRRPNRVSKGLSEILSVSLSIVYHKSTTMSMQRIHPRIMLPKVV
jgi:hypothetical protein